MEPGAFRHRAPQHPAYRHGVRTEQIVRVQDSIDDVGLYCRLRAIGQANRHDTCAVRSEPDRPVEVTRPRRGAKDRYLQTGRPCRVRYCTHHSRIVNRRHERPVGSARCRTFAPGMRLL